MAADSVLIALRVFGIYVGLGFLFSLIFLWKGLSKVDEDAKGTSFGFKLLLLPGLCFFWPQFLIKWIQAK